MKDQHKMKKPAWPLLLLVPALVSSCDMFSAGSYPYAESVYSACRRDTLISRLTRLKASGAYDHVYSFTDGPAEPSSPYYSFYFYSKETRCILFAVVGAGFGNREDAVLLVSLKEPRPDSHWQDFNHGLDEQRQRQVIAWFDEKIKPAITCK